MTTLQPAPPDTAQPRRYVAGRLKGVHAEPGTILGPNTTGEYLVVLTDDPDGVDLGYAAVYDLAAAIGHEPRSVTEHRDREVIRALVVQAAAAIVGGDDRD